MFFGISSTGRVERRRRPHPRLRVGAAIGSLLSVAAVSAIVAAVPSAASSPLAQAAAAPTPVSLFASTATPAVTAAPDSSAVELGVKFKSSTPGQVTGIRFYKGSGNTGTHTGSLWSSTGTRLATGTFINESAVGWQTLSFSSAVSVTANTTYVASYYAPTGRYSYTYDQFTSELVKAPLTALAGQNGVYRYGTSAFPGSSFRSTNYWVDPLFVAGTTLTTAPTTTRPSTTAPVTATTTRASTTASPTATATKPPSSTATPTTTPRSTAATTSSSAAACSTAQVWNSLDACGWAGPASTGYPDGQVFGKTVSGGLTITADNTVIDGYKISGGVQVRAQNVTIKNSWITNSAGGANGSGVININPGYSATIDRNLLDGQNATHTCIWHEGKSMVATANECIGANDGIFSWATKEGVDGTGDNFRIENNWLHAFTTSAANGHVDGYQTEGAKNGVIRHNTIDVTQSQTSAISIWNGRKNADNIVVDNNLLAGGGFTVYAEDYSPSEASPAGGYSVTNISFTNNRFSSAHYSCIGFWGVWFPRGAPTDGWKRSGNVVLESKLTVDAGNPAGCN